MIFQRPAWFEESDRNQRWLVGVSGGADSVALLHLLVRSGFRHLVVCHVNHQLRGDDSDLDECFVAGLAKSLGLVGVSIRVDVRRRMAEEKQSLETAARELRHEAFAAWAEEWQCDDVVLAHHADEQAETILWNLLRGSNGLKGMRKLQTIRVGSVVLNIHRPLLKLRKSELTGWLQTERLDWREDATNAEFASIRNRLRHQALPLLSEISGRDPVTALVQAEQDFFEWMSFAEDQLGQHRCLDPQGRLHLPALRNLSAVLQRLAIRDFLVSHRVEPLSRRLLDSALSMVSPTGPSCINLPGGAQLRRRQARMFIFGPANP